MLDLVRGQLAGEDVWIVGGAIRDDALGLEVRDVDVATRSPEAAARSYRERHGGALFPLSERFGAWRVALPDARTVDFVALRGSIREDLATRDFALNAIAERPGSDEVVDPFDGYGDLAGHRVRAVHEGVFADDPVRLLRAVRFEDELPYGFRMTRETEELVREHAHLVVEPAGERVLAELERLSAGGYRRLDELGLLAPLGGSTERLDRADSDASRLVAVFGAELRRLPVSNDVRRLASTLLRAERPADDSPRSIHRFRRATEPWAVEALRYLGADELVPALERARESDPAEPLLRGDELGLPPGPAIGRLLALVEEERAAGTISTREEALDLVRRAGVKPS